MEQVLIIDDDRELCEILTQYLAIENFQVTSVHEGESGVAAALSGQYALVLLDVMLPGFNGFEVLRRVRAAPSPAGRVPVLMLTARGDAMDRVVGLEVGADDYLPKPFNDRELVARIRAILRRAQAPVSVGEAVPPSERLRVGDVELEVGERRVLRGGEELELTAVEFDLLALLLRHAGHVVPRQTIALEVLDRQLLPFDRSIDTHISNLRRKIGPHTIGGRATGERIKTVRSVGYIYALPPAPST